MKDASAVPDFGGDECVVIVYGEDNFQGWDAVFGEGVYHYFDFKRAGGQDKDVSSVRVRGKDCHVVLN